MLTCLDQYKANKADNMNGGLRWIQKGGGYYSMCNRHLKGADCSTDPAQQVRNRVCAALRVS
jgi:hypothetical protein